MSGSTNLDWDSIESTVNDLDGYRPVDSELTSLTDLSSYLSEVSSAHCNFLTGDIINNLDPSSNGVAGDYKSAGDDYNSLISKLNNVLGYRSIDSDGSVASSGGGGGASSGGGAYSGGGSGGGMNSGSTYYGSGTSAPPASEMSKLSASSGSISPSIDSEAILSRKTESPTTTDSSTASASLGSIRSSAGSSVLGATGGVVSSVGGAIGGAALGSIVGSVGGLGGPGSGSAVSSINYPMGNYSVSSGFAHAFSDDEKQSITKVLEANGYSKEDIEKIFNGEYDTSNVLMESVSESLGEVAKKDPGLRDTIINKYGFDIFNEDGSINNDKLSMALHIDNMNGKDNYSMISLLSDQYGVNLVDQNNLNNFSNQFESLILKDYAIKDKIVSRYGFDIYNSDGTVNKDRLTLAMLIDSKKTDGVSLASIANEAISSDINDYLNTSIRSVNAPSKGDSLPGLIPVAATVAAVGAASGIGVAAHINKKKKSETSEKSDSERVDNIISLNTNHSDEIEDDKNWMKDIINNQ